MADMENMTGINENFDTIKTLLNSIRAQGILNTSDVDKLLSGINAKLEKINTEEDIDLIKVFLTELKQTLDERYNALSSKFSAIEALFSNLLKNSNELPKSSELKELFDIVATNLSVFSREVVAQKESITDITMRLDAIRSDDSQKKDIIKNITLLKPDLERLNNGFDTIVISLNDNFKTLAKTISGIDQTEHLNKFSDSLNGLEMSSSALLSALQLLDKKTAAVDEYIKTLATKNDLVTTGSHISELKQLNQDVKDSLREINQHCIHLDTLSDKIDASVSVIAGLKSILEGSEDRNTTRVLENIGKLEAKINEISDDTSFEEFKTQLNVALKEIADSTGIFNGKLDNTSDTLVSMLEILKALDVDTNFASLLSAIESGETAVKNHFDEKVETFTTLNEANLNRIIHNISENADSLNTKLNQTQSEIASICEGRFSTVFEDISDLKKIISQLDENGVSANNAMFSNISDRLTLFETVLKESLEKQEVTTSDASSKLCEQVDNIKNLSSVLDYKMDSSVVEISNMTRTFEGLKTAIDDILALNFVETVKDLRADIYASKQDIALAVETSGTNLNENITNDLYGKYELIVSKLDSVDDEFKKTQAASLSYIKEIMEKISSSLVDIVSYVSESKEFPIDEIDRRIDGLSEVLKEVNLDYVDNVRDAVDVIRVQVENNLKYLEEETSKKIDDLSKNVDMNTAGLRSDIQTSYDKLTEIQKLYGEIKELININSLDNTNRYDKLFENVGTLNSEFDNAFTSIKTSLLDKISDFRNEFACDYAEKVNEFKFTVENLSNKNSQNVIELIEELKVQLGNAITDNGNTRTAALNDITANLTELKTLITNYSDEALNTRTEALNKIYGNFENVKNSIKTLSDETYTGRKSGIEKILESINGIKDGMTAFSDANAERNTDAVNKISENYDALKAQIENLTEENSGNRTKALSKILENFVGLKEYVQSLNTKTTDELSQKTNAIIDALDSVKSILNKVDENVDGDMTRQLSIIESNFETLISQMTILNEKAEQSLVEKINDEYKNISERIDINVTQKLEEYKNKISATFDELSEKAHSQSSYLQERISDINSVMKSVWSAQSEQNMKQIEEISETIKDILDKNAEESSLDYNSLKDRLDEFTKDIGERNETLTHNLKAQLDDMTKYIDSVLDIQNQESDAHIDEFTQIIEALKEKLFEKTKEIKNLSDEQKVVSDSIRDDIKSLSVTTSEASESQIKAVEDASDRTIEQLELIKQTLTAVKDFMSETMQTNLKAVSSEIEKETDIIVSELVEQFEAVKKSQQDSAVQITTGIESIVESQIYNNIEDLKSYLDIKTDTSLLSEKLDNLKLEITSAFDNVISDMNKMLSSDVFTTAISDYRTANEILVNSAVDRINEKVAEFIGSSAKPLYDVIGDEAKNIENKLALFDKKFIDTVVDKYEEIKLVSNKYNDTFKGIDKSINDVLTDFRNVKNDVGSRIDDLAETLTETAESTNSEIRELNKCFENLRAQISNKSFDEAFQASINKQIASLESLIKEQYSCIEDINDLCEINLPDISELNTLVKGSVLNLLNSIKDTSEQINSKNTEAVINEALKTTKSDIITQFLNIFNQISFVTEQEEIIDFIQERHDELITILSHIVTTNSDISGVKNKLKTVDSKIDTVKEEIQNINDKITSIISSDGDVDYIYSLQDLESDIANLRIVLKEIQDNAESYGGEFGKLMTSTEDVYKLVESIQNELPDKKTFESLTEDIVSISTRTNKLILASDESYKTLQDNLHDFKLVIDDLDERTRNFAQDSGMNKIDSKLNALNKMVQNGARTNQVFNQVFEYLAEWVDNAGNQISAISNKVETLDDIGQIKVMLADLKAEAEDNSENVELIEALGNVFDKQAKKISALESKLDKMIVETTINNQKNKLDMKPMEDTLNKFLLVLEDKISAQQEKINSLESKLAKVVDTLDEKDTAQLTKKMGGMDRQIAKLNKSIEKIASHVVEK